MSADITIDVSEALRKLDPKEMDKALETGLRGAADLIRADIKTYPPAPAGSSYIRTGTLGRSWASKVQRREAIIGNVTTYAPYVQGADTQAWMHRGRWRTTAQVAASRAGDVRKLLEAAISRWARR